MVFFSLLSYTTIFDAIPTTYVKTHPMPQRTYRARFFVRDVARVHLCVMSQSQSALFGEGL